MTVQPIPQLTDDERRDALDKAASVRHQRLVLKEHVKSGDLALRDALVMTDAQGMRLVQLLMALPGYGRRRATLLMERLGIPANRRVRGLGRLQREALVREVGDGK